MELDLGGKSPNSLVNDTEFSKQMSDKGFMLTSAESVINWARTGSLHWMTDGVDDRR